MTVEWLLFSLEYPEAFLHEYLSEYNSTPPQLSEKEMSTFFSLLFADIDRKVARSTDEVSKEEMRDNLLLSIGLLVRHARLAYADILKMSVKYFYFYLENMEIILGTKSPEEKQSTKSDRIDSQALLRLKNGIF